MPTRRGADRATGAEYGDLPMNAISRTRRTLGPGLRLSVAAVLFLTWSAHAQLGISLRLDRRNYLRYEPIRATVQLRNYTGNTIMFPKQPGLGKLTFTVSTRKGTYVRCREPDLNPAEGLILGAGETRELALTLNNLYSLQAEDVYTVAARIGHPRLSYDYKSKPVQFEVRSGLVAWERTIGVPSTSATAKIAQRKATLLAFRDDDEETYALRIEDDKVVFGVVRLGPHLSGSEAQCDSDALSNVHVLSQTSPRLYAHRVFDYNAKVKQEKYYFMEKTVPRLRRDPEVGRVFVSGGRPAVRGVDYMVPGEDNPLPPVGRDIMQGEADHKR